MTLLDQLSQGLITSSPEATMSIAGQLAQSLPVDVCLALHGDLGVGKTTFVRGLARGFDIQETITSPSFNIYYIYSGRRNLIHLDAYRLENEAQAEALMLDEFLESPYCLVVEWPNKILPFLPKNTYHLELTIQQPGKHCLSLRF